jgi:hypothetical protein
VRNKLWILSFILIVGVVGYLILETVGPDERDLKKAKRRKEDEEMLLTNQQQ